MRICHIWDSEYPWDIRAAKVSRALTDAGHDVHMVARNRDGRPLVEKLEECTVHRLEPVPFVGRALNAASMFPAFFNPRWRRKILRTATEIRADVLLVRDLPLAPTAIWAGRRLGLPVVLDMAENYPAMIRAIYWDDGHRRLRDWFVRNPAVASWIERWTLARLDHTLVVVEESKTRLLQLGVDPSAITIVSNTPPVEGVALGEPTTRKLRSDQPLQVVYLGILENPRGIGTLIQAIHRCRKSGISAQLTIIGDGRDRGDFERQVRDLGLTEEHVRFLGFIPNAEALKLVRSADVGVIPHHADESWNTTIPNKLFDYMVAGIPVVASNAVPVERILNETGCGVAFADRDPDDFARAIGQMRDDAVRAECARAGRRAIAERYHWSRDAQELVRSLEQVVATRMAGQSLSAAGEARLDLRGTTGKAAAPKR